MEKYSLNEGNESLKRILLMMSYDNKKTLEENTKIIFEQDNIPVVNQDEDNALDPKIVAKAEQSTGTNVPSDSPATAAPATPEVSLSYEDTVKKLQNLLITKYQAYLGKFGADGKIGKLTLDAIANAVNTKLSQNSTDKTTNDATTPETKDDETITPEDKPETTITPETTPAVNPGSVDDWK
jgi:hypothetical protein